jgi:hypothetical protein
LCYASLFDLLGPTTRADAQNGKRTFSSSNVKDFLKFQTGSIIGAIEDDILLDDRTGWIHKVAVEILLTSHRNEQHYLGYLIDFDNSRVSLGHQVGYQKVPTKPQ